MHIGDITAWARGTGLEVVLLTVGAILAARLVHWLSARYVKRLERRAQRQPEDDLMPDDAAKHLRTLAQAAEWLVTGIVYFVAALFVLARFQLPVTSLVVPATAIGAALGFGAQRVVQDLLAGFFVFAERQYGFGDLVELSAVGEATGVSGTVEEVTLRTTRLRTVRGELIIVPNGSFQKVINRSRDWSRVIIDVPIPLNQDVDRATEVLREEAAGLAADEEWRKLLLDDPVVAGIESIQAGYLQLRITARTLPTRQVEVARELRRRIAEGLKQSGIAAASPIA